MKRVAVLGSTGSVGVQTLEVVAANPERFRVTALAAGDNVESLAEQVRRFAPDVVSVRSEQGARRLRGLLGGAAPHIEHGGAGLLAVATHDADLVMAALVGAIGLAPTLAAIRAGRDVALANKEVMVMAGALVRREVEAHGVELLPVDSEHSAIFQSLAGHRIEDVDRLILTCSGGPFRDAEEWPAERLNEASVAEALDHPNWDMGAKISVDSATLMNKGLEVIEARWLFDVSPDRVDVVIHPQSIIHSMVEYRDTSVVAQLGLPDMRVPIAVAMAHPERVTLDVPRLDLAQQARLDFHAPDRDRFPCLDLAYRALRGSEQAPAVLNAANEVAVAAFLDRLIPFGAIADTNQRVLDAHLHESEGSVVDELDDVTRADAWAREAAREVLGLDAEAASAKTAESAAGQVG
jgi:1-deoxy-D-xylulose-5-phosphate reductoisomerase